MSRAVSSLSLTPEHLLVDARTIPKVVFPQTNMIHGDSRSQSIAAASILAKVRRDAIMKDYSLIYTQFGFEKNKGYGTKSHIEQLRHYGPSPIHRQSFAPVRDALANSLE